MKRFLAGEIGLDELKQEFALLLQDDSDLPMSAAAWLDAGAKDGRLSATVCTAIKNELASHLAAAFFDADPANSGIFDRLDNSLAQHQDARPAGNEPIPRTKIATLVPDAGSTAIDSRSVGSQGEPHDVQKIGRASCRELV